MKLTKYLLVFGCLLLGSFGFSVAVAKSFSQIVRVPAKKEYRYFDAFDEVVFSVPGKLVLKQGAENSLRIEADEAALSEIDSTVIDRTLLVTTMAHHKVGNPLNRTKYILTFKNINNITLNSTTTLESKDTLTFDNLDLNIKGSNQVYLTLKAKRLKTTIWGTGHLALSGDVAEQNVKIFGAGKYSALKLKTERATLNVLGTGMFKLQVGDELDVFSSGSARVLLKGDPKIYQKASGTVRITPIG